MSRAAAAVIVAQVDDRGRVTSSRHYPARRIDGAAAHVAALARAGRRSRVTYLDVVTDEQRCAIDAAAESED